MPAVRSPRDAPWRRARPASPPRRATGAPDRRRGLVRRTTQSLRVFDRRLPPSRWYRADQVEQARLVRRLRALDLPLDEVRTLLDFAAADAAGPPSAPRSPTTAGGWRRG